MTRVPLLGGPYQARSVISSAAKAINIYPEVNPQESQSPAPVTHYPRPGLALMANAVTGSYQIAPTRSLYRATDGQLFAVVGSGVYFVDTGFGFNLIGKLSASSQTPVSMADNGQCLVLVDGSAQGYAVRLSDRAFGQIVDPAFYGADRVDYLDTYFVFNRPATAQFYICLSNVTYEMLTGGGITTGTVSNAGTGYPGGIYSGVALTGGSGTGATATIRIPAGIASGTVTNAGASYTNGTYTNVALSGGSGTGALATIVVASAKVSSVTITTPGAGYLPNDNLSCSAGAVGGTGSGFVYQVNTLQTASVGTVTITNEGTGYRAGDILSADAASLGNAGSGFAYTVASIAGNSFDPLDIAGKTGGADDIQGCIAVHGELWLIGALTTEVWVNVGAADFTFQRLPGAFIDHGCSARYSIAKQDVSVFWLSQDREGQGIVIQTQGYTVKRISTHAIEAAIQSYSRIDDAIGFCFQQQGHAFYVLSFPTADVSWAYELKSGQWHQLAYTDLNGVLHRHRANCCTFAYGKNLVGDWQNGNLYAMDPNVFTDNGQPIVCTRTFPHMVDDGNRITYQSFIADMQVGTLPGSTTDNPPVVSLRWSDDRGATFGNAVTQPLGAGGDYLTSVQWNRLGMARDRVFELSWSAPARTALNGAFVDIVKHRS